MRANRPLIYRCLSFSQRCCCCSIPAAHHPSTTTEIIHCVNTHWSTFSSHLRRWASGRANSRSRRPPLGACIDYRKQRRASRRLFAGFEWGNGRMGACVEPSTNNRPPSAHRPVCWWLAAARGEEERAAHFLRGLRSPQTVNGTIRATTLGWWSFPSMGDLLTREMRLPARLGWPYPSEMVYESFARRGMRRRRVLDNQC